jgi:hypothetical protein
MLPTKFQFIWRRGFRGEFMIRVTRQMKCLIAHAVGVIPHPLSEVNFLMVEIPTPKPCILFSSIVKFIPLNLTFPVEPWFIIHRVILKYFHLTPCFQMYTIKYTFLYIFHIISPIHKTV